MGGFSGCLREEKMGKGFPEPGKLLGDICWTWLGLSG